MALTIPQIVSIAEVSQYLALTSKTNGKIYDGGNFNLVRLLYMVRKNVDRKYNQDPTDDTLTATSNYLLALCGPYRFIAEQKVIAGGGGSISPITPPTSIVPYDFQVDGSSFIPTGGTSVTLPIEWQGLNIILVRGGVPQSMINDGVSACYSWDKNTRLLTLINAPATSTELIQIYPIL